MGLVPIKEVEHRACLVPRPQRGNDYDAPFVSLNASAIREEAEKFGLEVIDIWWTRHVLAALANYLEQQERLWKGVTCPGCGVIAKHFPGCKETA